MLKQNNYELLPLRSFCLERLTFLASCPRPESVISEDNDLVTCGLCFGEDPGEELSSVLEPGLPMLRSLFSLRKLPPDPDLVTIPEPFSASSSACLSLG